VATVNDAAEDGVATVPTGGAEAGTPTALDARARLTRARRVVVKVGTAVVARGDGRLALGRMGALVEQLRALEQAGRQVLLVSSGAVGLGAERLGFERKPTSVVDRQACAAAGQSALMAFYDALFTRLGGRCAQVLLTEDDFKVRRRHVHLSATLERLLELGVTPIINENDVVSTAEIALRGAAVFGDNDRLGTLVASGVQADVLVLLTDVDGVHTGPPGTPGAARIPVWDRDVEVVLGVGSTQGRGGMGAKIGSARIGQQAGVDVVVASGHDPGVLARVFAGDDVGTLFPGERGLSGRKRWMAFATAPVGKLVVNDGARDALVQRNASLLWPGVVSVEGDFDAGAVVSVCGPDGVEFARGRADAAASSLRAATGPSRRPVIHRDHVVILEGEGP
jgi:glutamate 5-kinase